jgi:anti-sigma factor RsiW
MRFPFRRRPRPMTCHEVAEVLQTYLDDETDEVAARRVAHHLEDCVRCGLEVVTYRHIKETIVRGAPELDTATVERLRAFGERVAAGHVTGDGDATGW